jgi:hypothetical protein
LHQTFVSSTLYSSYFHRGTHRVGDPIAFL